jgi:hypothetical protein
MAKLSHGLAVNPRLRSGEKRRVSNGRIGHARGDDTE